jgi:hypothetical protein
MRGVVTMDTVGGVPDDYIAASIKRLGGIETHGLRTAP